MLSTFSVPPDYKKCDHLKKFPLNPVPDKDKKSGSSKSRNKEIWLFNLPADLDVSKLKTFPIDTTRSSSIKINDKTYEIEQEREATSDGTSNLALLIPDEKREALSVCFKGDEPIKFDRVFTISESADIPEIDYEKLRVPRRDVPKIEGLIARHFATGYGPEEEEGEGNGEGGEIVKSEESRKRSHDSESIEESTESLKKKKKQKKDKEKKSKKEKKDKKRKDKK